MTNRVRKFEFLFLWAVAFSWQGCGGPGDMPEIGEVSGTVTLDGKPLPGALIKFKPDVGRVAAAVTDPEGNYFLKYKDGVDGTKLGPNTVSFEYELGSSGPPIPRKWGDRSEEKVDVKAGANDFDFALTSDAPKGAAKH
jgi:hypothetical protein